MKQLLLAQFGNPHERAGRSFCLTAGQGIFPVDLGIANEGRETMAIAEDLVEIA